MLAMIFHRFKIRRKQLRSTFLNYFPFFTFLFLILFNTHFTFSQWVIQNTGTNSVLEDIEFINRYTGWACGAYGTILKTTDGGAIWLHQNSGVSNYLRGIHPVDSEYVFCVGHNQTILKSTNGGTNWIIIRNGIQGAFTELYFLNRNTGWILKDQYVLVTKNGCNSFDSVYYNYDKNDVFFKDSLNGLMCSGSSVIHKTYNGGYNWYIVPLPAHWDSPPVESLTNIGDTVWAFAQNTNDLNLGKYVWRSTNFGQSWDSIARIVHGYTINTYSSYFTSAMTGWCAGGNFISKTTNGGFNWIDQVIQPNGILLSLWFYNDSIGWAAAQSGKILHTSTGGQYVDVENISNTVPKEFKLYQNYPNPFNNKTIIEIDITKESYYKLEVYNLIGEKKDILINKKLKAGGYKINYKADKLASGIYIYTLKSEYNIETKKFTLIK